MASRSQAPAARWQVVTWFIDSPGVPWSPCSRSYRCEVTAMTHKEAFFFGAIGGILPLLVSIFTIDVGSIIDHGGLTTGNYIGYGLRVVALVIAGGIVALVNSEVKNRLTLMQLGIAAPALLTSYINAASPAAKPQNAHTAFSIVSVANA